MSLVNIGEESMAEWNAGNGTVGTTAQQLAQSGAAPAVKKHVVVQANAGNIGTVKVGPNASLAASGFVLAAGEQTPPIYIDDLSKVWVVGSAAGQGYSFICT